MKTERRHELQHNVLADALENAAENVKPYTQLILGVVLAIAVVIGVYGYWNTTSQANLAESWNSYLAATASDNIDELRKVSENHPGTPAAVWANLTLGDRSLSQGLDQLFSNRADANDELKKAESFYQSAKDSAHEPLLEQRATLGLARVYESLVKLDKAKEEYERIRTKWPTGVYVAVANQRLEDLNKQSTKEFYDWFAANEPKRSVDGLGTPGLKPPFEAPEHPGVDFNLNSLSKPPGESGAAKPDEVDIKLTPPLLGSEKEKSTPEKKAEETTPPEKKSNESSPEKKSDETPPPSEKKPDEG